MIQLTKRLQSIADRIPRGCRMADIGSDHALLPTYLAEQKRISFAVAGEVNEGPFEAAYRQVKQSGAAAVVDVRRGDGLSVIAPGEVDVVVIAGMGGALITRILSEGMSKLAGVKRLVLQPNVAEDTVRQWLLANEWRLVDETIVEETGRRYEILVAESGGQSGASLYEPYTMSCGIVVDRPLLLKMGPYLLREGSKLFCEKWIEEARKLRRICAQMQESAAPEAMHKHTALLQEAATIEEVIACLQKGKRSSR